MIIHYEEKLQQQDVQLVLQKDEILSAIDESKRSSALNCDTISVLGESDFLSIHPLGDVELLPWKTVKMDDEPCSTLDYDFEKVLPTTPTLPNDRNTKRSRSVPEAPVQATSEDSHVNGPPTYQPPAYPPTNHEGKDIPFCPQSLNDLSIGMKVSVNRRSGRVSHGTVKWIGAIPRHNDSYVGIELDSDADGGRSDGTLDGVKYFSCRQGHGLFVKFNKVIIAWKQFVASDPLVDLNPFEPVTNYEQMGYCRFKNDDS